MGNWWQAASPRQCTSSCITSQAEFWGKTSNHPGDSALLPDFASCNFWILPKTKITFEREEILDHQWDSGRYKGTSDGDWENCVKSQSAYFEGDWGVIVLSTVFLVSSINVSIFHITWLDAFWTDLVFFHDFFHSTLWFSNKIIYEWYLWVCVYIYIHYICVCIYICTLISVCVYVYTHTHIHIYTHTHTHTQRYISPFLYWWIPSVFLCACAKVSLGW